MGLTSLYRAKGIDVLPLPYDDETLLLLYPKRISRFLPSSLSRLERLLVSYRRSARFSYQS